MLFTFLSCQHLATGILSLLISESPWAFLHSLSLYPDLETLLKEWNSALVGMTSFIFHLSRISAFLVDTQCFWKHLIHMFCLFLQRWEEDLFCPFYSILSTSKRAHVCLIFSLTNWEVHKKAFLTIMAFFRKSTCPFELRVVTISFFSWNTIFTWKLNWQTNYGFWVFGTHLL